MDQRQPAGGPGATDLRRSGDSSGVCYVLLKKKVKVASQPQHSEQPDREDKQRGQWYEIQEERDLLW